MTDSEREKLANLFRDLSLQVETVTYDASTALRPEFISELLNSAARLCDAADILETSESAAISLARRDKNSANASAKPEYLRRQSRKT